MLTGKTGQLIDVLRSQCFILKAACGQGLENSEIMRVKLSRMQAAKTRRDVTQCAAYRAKGPGSLSPAQNKTTKCNLSNPLWNLGQDLEKAECIVSDAAEMETGSDVDIILILILRVRVSCVVNRIVYLR